MRHARGLDLADEKFEWHYRNLVGRRWRFFRLSGQRLLLRLVLKPGGSLQGLDPG
jgi:hypothetical protein